MMSPSPKTDKQLTHASPTFQLTVSTASNGSPGEDESTEMSSSSPSTDAPKSQCSSLSDGESFECYGESDLTTTDNATSVSINTSSSNGVIRGGRLNGLINGGRSGGGGGVNGVPEDCDPELNLTGEECDSMFRHTWARSSLRRPPPPSASRRQLGSNALASQLYRSASFNSSGRSSNCDNPEEMYSDEDVHDLNHKVELLQRQVSNLAATQTNNEDVTSRTKTDYAVLQARYYMLEEQLRECELRTEQRLQEEQKNHKELLLRVEREAQLTAENYEIRLRTSEKEGQQMRDDMQRLRVLHDKQASDLHLTEEKLELTQEHCQSLQQENEELRQAERKLVGEKKAHQELLVEMDKEMERIRSERGPALPTTSPESIRLEELHQELDELRQANKNLQETNDELQALVLTRGVEEGINLLNGTSNSLAQELQDMSQSQDSIDSTVLSSLTQLQSAFKDKEEENVRLKHYIDTILLNIVENYPQLLEVKAVNGGSASAVATYGKAK